MPSEVAALLRIRQMRERRAQVAALAARQVQDEAAALRTAAEQARTDFAAVARQRREAAYGWLEQADDVRALALQHAAAEIAELGMRDAALVAAVGWAASTEAGRRAAAAGAARHHAAAQRGAEALDALAAEIRASLAAAAERAEEAEAEEPRARP